MEERDEARGARRLGRAIGGQLTYANVMATIAVFVAVGGGTFAIAARGPVTKRGAIQACYVKKGKRAGQLRLLLKGRCKKRRNERKIAWAKQGRPGPAGAQGPKGDKGAQGQKGDKGSKGDKGDTGPSSFAASCNEGLGPNDVMVRVGSVCIDRYEASIWDAPTGGNQITGAIPCSANGQDCTDIYARSVAGVQPRASITWFQAQQALANSGKRLPSNAEWQMAVAGTPDSTACSVETGSAQSTGANPGCVSRFGVDDMVGNLWEWVADWAPGATCVSGSWESFSNDYQGICGAAESGPPGALIRGGDFGSGTIVAGPFAVDVNPPSDVLDYIGLRGAR